MHFTERTPEVYMKHAPLRPLRPLGSPRRPRSRPTVASLLAAGLLLAGMATSAQAQQSQPATAGASEPASPADTMTVAKEHFRNGIAAYNEGRFEDAISELKQAYLLSHIPVLLFNIADTYEKMGQPVKAFHYYTHYLAEAKPDDKQVPIARVRVQALRAIAASQPSAAGPGAASAPVAAAAPASAPARRAASAPKVFRHDVVDTAPPNLPLDIHAEVPPGTRTATLFYREPGHDTFTAVPMKPRYRELVGRIPAHAMSGTSIQYYVEARDADNSILGHSGKSSSPNIVYIDPSAQPQYFADFTEGGEAPPPAEPIPPGAAPAGPAEQASAAASQAATASVPAPEATPGRSWRNVTIGAAIGAGVSLSLALVFDRLAAADASAFEGQAVASTMGGTAPPDQIFGPKLHAYETLGHFYTSASSWSLGIGAGLAVVSAGSYLLYWRATRAEEPETLAPEGHAPQGPQGPEMPSSPDDEPVPGHESSLAPRFLASPVVLPHGGGFAAVVSF